MPIVKWGETIQDELLNSGWSREIEHDPSRRGDVPVFIDCVYQQGRCDERQGGASRLRRDAPFIDTPRDARNHYSKRFGIESSYRLAKQSLAFTSSQGCWTAAGDVCSEPIASEQLAVSSLDVLRRPAAGRRLWRWSFTEFCEMVLRAAWTALGVRRSVPANQPLDDRFFR